MNWKFLRAGFAVALIGFALIVNGCGGGSSASPSTASGSGPAAEPSAQFLRPTGKNTIVKFGEEASAEERSAANVVVVANLKARETEDWATQCSTLNKVGLDEIPVVTGQKNCPDLLAKFARPLSATKEIRKDRLAGSIVALRVNGDKGYALFHGTDGKDYALPLEKEAGSWKVSSLNTLEI